MKPYKRIFKEENSLSELTDTKIVDEIINFIKSNPFPKDHEQFHKHFESLDVDKIEQYVYAMLSVFLCGGKAFNSDKTKIDFSDQENKDGYIVEAEHFISDSDNKVVKYISDLFRDRIALDHHVDNDKYYEVGKKVDLFDELKKGK